MAQPVHPLRGRTSVAGDRQLGRSTPADKTREDRVENVFAFLQNFGHRRLGGAQHQSAVALTPF
ncbi:unnamed protein product [Laminaria digitata]